MLEVKDTRWGEMAGKSDPRSSGTLREKALGGKLVRVRENCLHEKPKEKGAGYWETVLWYGIV